MGVEVFSLYRDIALVVLHNPVVDMGIEVVGMCCIHHIPQPQGHGRDICLAWPHEECEPSLLARLPHPAMLG